MRNIGTQSAATVSILCSQNPQQKESTFTGQLHLFLALVDKQVRCVLSEGLKPEKAIKLQNCCLAQGHFHFKQMEAWVVFFFCFVCISISQGIFLMEEIFYW